VRQCLAVRQCAAMQAAVYGSAYGSVRAVSAAVCGSAHGSVVYGSACDPVRAAVRHPSVAACGSTAVCTNTAVCGNARGSECGSVHSSVWQCVWQCATVLLVVF
jgi:hypothetical protein